MIRLLSLIFSTEVELCTSFCVIISQKPTGSGLGGNQKTKGVPNAPGCLLLSAGGDNPLVTKATMCHTPVRCQVNILVYHIGHVRLEALWTPVEPIQFIFVQAQNVSKHFLFSRGLY